MVPLKLTEHITLQGEIIKVEERYVHCYTGVPYASRSALLIAPGELTYPTEETVIDATTAGAICPQISDSDAPEKIKQFSNILLDNGGAKEDALNCASLDIYVPAAPGNKKRNVVIYVHGGGLTSGSRFQALNRADKIHRFDELKETIWINVGYSLGPLGFWAIRDKDGAIQANAAIHEIIRAIKWVHDYIPKFGGDTDDITLIGHSAGAALVQTVHFVLRNWAMFDFTQQPFHKLAIMSGSSYLFKFISIEDAIARQKAVINQTPCRHFDEEAQDVCMQSLSGKEIIKAAHDANVVWGPVIDNINLKGDAEWHLRNKEFLEGTKVMATTTHEDCTLFCHDLKSDIKSLGHRFWKYLGHKDLIQDFQTSYPASEYQNCNYACAVRAITDAIFVGPALGSAQHYRAHDTPVAMHEFRFSLEKLDSGPVRILTRLAALAGSKINEYIDTLKSMGTFHGLEIALLFNVSLSNNGVYQIESLTNRRDCISILQPLFDFIQTGATARATLMHEILFPTQCINVPTVTEGFYSGKVKAALIAKRAKTRVNVA